jgi:hypothetical protein
MRKDAKTAGNLEDGFCDACDALVFGTARCVTAGGRATVEEISAATECDAVLMISATMKQ